MCVSVCVSCRRSVQLGRPTSLTRNLANSVVPEHSLRQMVFQYLRALRKCPNKTSHIYLHEVPLTCQPRDTILMTKLNRLCVFLVSSMCLIVTLKY